MIRKFYFKKPPKQEFLFFLIAECSAKALGNDSKTCSCMGVGFFVSLGSDMFYLISRRFDHPLSATIELAE